MWWKPSKDHPAEPVSGSGSGLHPAVLVPGPPGLGRGAGGPDRGAAARLDRPTGPRRGQGGVAMAAVWVAIAASLVMGLAAACVFVFAVKRDYFRKLEEVKKKVY